MNLDMVDLINGCFQHVNVNASMIQRTRQHWPPLASTIAFPAQSRPALLSAEDQCLGKLERRAQRRKTLLEERIPLNGATHCVSKVKDNLQTLNR